MTAFPTPAELADLQPADLATVNAIRLEIARHKRRQNEADKAREAAAAANTHARRRTDEVV